VVALALAGGVGCGGAPASGAAGAAAGGAGVPFHELASGRVSAVAQDEGAAAGAQGRVLRSRAGAAKVLRAWGMDMAVASLSDVHFDRSAVVAVLAPERPSSGFRARVSRVSLAGALLTVHATIRRPDGITDLQTISRPWVVVTVARSAVAGARSVARVRLG
jgi:hypothetical protein